ncbi:hypothetical protein LOTGIDRAFT_116335, partial [Lottia gigantea]
SNSILPNINLVLYYQETNLILNSQTQIEFYTPRHQSSTILPDTNLILYSQTPI